MSILRLLGLAFTVGGIVAGAAVIAVGVALWPPAVLVLLWFVLWVGHHIRADRRASRARITAALALHDDVGPSNVIPLPRGRRTKADPALTYDPNLPSSLD